MSNCIGLMRFEAEAHIAAIVADVIIDRPDLTDANIVEVRDFMELSSMVERGAMRRCSVHPDHYLSKSNIECLL